MNLNQTVTISDEVVFQEVSGETVLLDLNSESYFGLDSVGTRIWQLIVDDQSLQSVFTALLKEFEVEEATLINDLDELFHELQAQGLVSLSDGR
jgi:hypothetical protein